MAPPSVSLQGRHQDVCRLVRLAGGPGADGYDAETAEAWSVVIRGHGEEISKDSDLIDTIGLPLFPWQAGDKQRFNRIVPTSTSGRRFPVADPGVWLTPLSGLKRASME